MLYLTTRDKFDAHTTARALNFSRAEDGGFYIPFQMPKLMDASVWEDKSFSQTVSEILNLFFSCRITPLDVEFAVGRHALRLNTIQQRISICELWHNLDMTYLGMERILANLVTKNENLSTSWLRIAIRISVLFGIYGELRRKEIVACSGSFDLALPADDFSFVMAAWYARQMGLPVANIVCGCDEGAAVWDLLSFGKARLNLESLPGELERLICGGLGVEETKRFCEVLEKKGTYSVQTEELEKLRRGIFPAVVSAGRVGSVIPNVYRTSGYVLAPDAACAYAALSDYRAQTGEGRVALILADRNPSLDCKFVASAMNVSQEELKTTLGMI